MLPVKEKDLQALESVLSTGLFAKPNLKISVSSNITFLSISYFLKPMFCTDLSYQIMEIKDLEILVEEEINFEKGEQNEPN